MLLEPHFLPWSRPLLPEVATLLTDRYRSSEEVSLEDVVVAVPGSRAGRRLVELLIDRATTLGRALIPPRVVTVGSLPEVLYQPEHPIADGPTRRLAWARALHLVRPEELAAVFPEPPASDDLLGSSGLARILDRIHREVGAGGMGFAEVARRCQEGFLFRDVERWTVLAKLQQSMEKELVRHGRIDRERARRRALDSCEMAEGIQLWLVGIPEMPGILQEMLRRGRAPVQPVIHAPEDEEAAFDDLGCVQTDYWCTREVSIPDTVLRICDRPTDQADEVLRFLADLPMGSAPEDVTVGMPDDSLLPYLSQRLAAYGIPHRYAVGMPVTRTAPFRLLSALADYLDGNRFASLAALVRHPDVGAMLGDIPAAEGCDRHFTRFLPTSVRPPREGGEPPKSHFRRALSRLQEEGIIGRLDDQRTLSQWMPEILRLLARVYGDTPVAVSSSEGRLLAESCAMLRNTAASFYELPRDLDLECESATAIRLLLGEVPREPIAPEPDQEAVELVGWLEIHLDDAPNLIVTGVNEPFLPEAVNADAFLPNSLRSRLGLQDNRTRLARDAYRLCAVLNSRERVALLAGRRDARGDPLGPSRLLFTSEDRSSAERVLRLTASEPEIGVAGFPEIAVRGGDRSRFSLPPEPTILLPRTPQLLPVTDFRILLRDPYRWALERVLRLKVVDDEERELDPSAFGSFVHRVLDSFGRSAECNTPDPDTAYRWLTSALDELAGATFGPQALPAVHVQTEQLRLRLRAFADSHAEWIARGWEVVATEVETDEGGFPFDVDGTPIGISGRIDRIDRHRESGAWALLDYKTSEDGKSPDAVHRRSGEWVDLQLPLYRLLLPSLRTRDGQPLGKVGKDADVRLGYFLLPGDKKKAGIVLADWDAATLVTADEAARDVVRELRRNPEIPFQPEGVRTGAMDPYATLLGRGVVRALNLGEEVEG